MQLDLVQAAGLVYIVASTMFGFWQLRQNRRQRETAQGRQTRDDLVTLLQTKLEFAEREIEVLKARVSLQESQIAALSHLPFDKLSNEHAAILTKLGGSTG